MLLSMHGHGKAANRCLGQKRSANLSLSAYMQVGGANETNGQRCFSSGTCGFEPFVHGLQVAAEAETTQIEDVAFEKRKYVRQ